MQTEDAALRIVALRRMSGKLAPTQHKAVANPIVSATGRMTQTMMHPSPLQGEVDVGSGR